MHFAQGAQGLDDSAKLRLILVAAGVKPATFLRLKINPKNIDEKRHLEYHLLASKLLFLVDKPRAYEEITGIRGNTVHWKILGSWYGYDIFSDRKSQRSFTAYKTLLKQQKHAQADAAAGKLYGYPNCCIKKYIAGNMPDTKQAFPLVQHTPCSSRCSASRKLNARYSAALKEHTPSFWKRLAAQRKFRTDVAVTETKPAAVTVLPLKPLEGRYYFLTHPTKKQFSRGTVLPARIAMQYASARVMLGKPKRIIKGLHHERHFILQ
jgi:hypothetical protein